LFGEQRFLSNPSVIGRVDRGAAVAQVANVSVVHSTNGDQAAFDRKRLAIPDTSWGFDQLALRARLGAQEGAGQPQYEEARGPRLARRVRAHEPGLFGNVKRVSLGGGPPPRPRQLVRGGGWMPRSCRVYLAIAVCLYPPCRAARRESHIG